MEKSIANNFYIGKKAYHRAFLQFSVRENCMASISGQTVAFACDC